MPPTQPEEISKTTYTSRFTLTSIISEVIKIKNYNIVGKNYHKRRLCLSFEKGQDCCLWMQDIGNNKFSVR